MKAFEENRLREALDRMASAPVPPFPYEAIVRAGTHRRRLRRTLGGACAAAAVAAASVLAITAGSGPSRVVTPPPAHTPAPGEPASGVLHGAHWSVRLRNYTVNGGYCSYWQIDVDGRVNPTASGGCEPHPPSQSDVSFEEAEVRRDPTNASSAQIGALFLGNGAPAGAVTLRARWAGGSVEARIFHLHGDTRGYYVLAVPFDPGHPKSYYVTDLAFLDASGHVVASDVDHAPVPWHIDYPPAKK